MHDHERGQGSGDGDGDLCAERMHEVGRKDQGGGYRAVKGEAIKGVQGDRLPWQGLGQSPKVYAARSERQKY